MIIPPDRFLQAARDAHVLDDARREAIERAVAEAAGVGMVVDIAATLEQRGVITAAERASIERAGAIHLSPAPDDQTLLDMTGSHADPLVAESTIVDSHQPSRHAPSGGAVVVDQDRYEYGQVIGSGGVGEIRLVVDRRIGRQVAMKTLHKPENRAHRLRFEREAQLTGQLEHPFIVPVHEAGTDGHGRPYFTMKLVRGRTLGDWLRDLDTAAIDKPDAVSHALSRKLEVFHRICDAVGYAHAHGVIHRDLKPANVMIGEFGEVLVMDWGLAARFGDAKSDGDAHATGSIVDKVHLDADHDTRVLQPQLTADGALIGTPAYMSPEQALGEISTLDERSDIYALGTILYEMLTHSCPFAGTDTLDVLRRVMAGEFEPPIERAPDRRIPVDIDTVVRKAMARHPADRHANVTELQDALRGVVGTRVKREIGTSRALDISQLAVISLGRTARMLISAMNNALAEFDMLLPENNVARMLVGAGEDGLTLEQIDQRMIGYVPDIPALLDMMRGVDLLADHPSTPATYIATARAKEVVEKTRARLDPYVTGLLSDMSEDEHRQLAMLLDRARESISRHGE